MKSIFKIGCGFLLFAVVLIVVLLMYGKSSGEAIVKEIFTLAAKEQPDELLAKIHSGLKDEADPEMIHLFFKGLLKECGNFEGLNMNGMNFSDNYTNGIRKQDFSGTFRFKNKEVTMEMNFVDGLLFGFEVKDAAVSNAALKETRVMPAGAENRYAAIAEKFWQDGLSGKEEEAFSMLNENVQKQFGREKITGILKGVNSRSGKPVSIKFTSSRPEEAGSNKYLFFFTIDFAEAKNILAHINFEFFGFKGHLAGFAIPSDETP